MRWQPEAQRCAECDFDWSLRSKDAVSLVKDSPQRVAAVMVATEAARRRPAPNVWSPSAYLWHLVDVLRIGAERLLTTKLDPEAGIPCWDENELAAVRRYDALSPRVALAVYERAVGEWVAVANDVPGDASVRHPAFGMLTAGDIVRRNAHEVGHHELDIRRGMEATVR